MLRSYTRSNGSLTLLVGGPRQEDQYHREGENEQTENGSKGVGVAAMRDKDYKGGGDS